MDELELLVQAVRKSPKYRSICLDVVRNVGARELAARHDWRDAVKATKNKLHQVGGAYWDGADYAGWLDQMRNAATAGNEPRQERGTEYQGELRRVCWEAMKHHSSTRERLAILDQFYTRTLAGLPPPQVVLDIACGLNPLAISWMPFAALKTLPFAALKTLPFAALKTLPFAALKTLPFQRGVQYYAYDMYTDLASFLNTFMGIAGIQGHAEARDVLRSPPTTRADLALILKTLPCVEQLDKEAGATLLEAIQADHLLVSFPARSLGGRDKRMVENYEAHFQQLLLGKPWSVQRFEFSTELAFLIHK
jgi:16S rRNA (guanine(1405)-N(7))-methyltransferase